MQPQTNPATPVVISVVVPVRNMGTTVGRTLASLVSQDYPHLEIIVIEGLSKDDTLDQVAPYRDRVAHIVSEADGGYYDALNKGISLASGDVIGVLNGDDYYPNAGILSRYAARFFGSPVQLVFGDIEFFPELEPSQTIRLYSSRTFRPAKLKYGWMPPHPSVFVRKEVYRKVGNYRTDYRIAADYEFLIRALLVHEVPYDRIDAVVVRMQYGGISTSGIRATYRLNKEIIRACRENGVNTNWFYIAWKFPRKLMEFVLPRRPTLD